MRFGGGPEVAYWRAYFGIDQVCDWIVQISLKKCVRVPG